MLNEFQFQPINVRKTPGEPGEVSETQTECRSFQRTSIEFPLKNALEVLGGAKMTDAN